MRKFAAFLFFSLKNGCSVFFLYKNNELSDSLTKIATLHIHSNFNDIGYLSVHKQKFIMNSNLNNMMIW